MVRTLASIAGALGSIPDQELKKKKIFFKNVKLVNYSIKNGRGKLIHINKTKSIPQMPVALVLICKSWER